MLENAKITLAGYTRYKGLGQYLFLLHRITGIGLFIFFSSYILALAGVGPVVELYKNWLFQVIILFCVFFHALNGLRITILDVFANLIPHRNQAIWVQWIVFLLLYGFAVFVILRTSSGG